MTLNGHESLSQLPTTSACNKHWLHSNVWDSTYVIAWPLCNVQTAVTVFDLLDYYESCERLNISYNKNLGIRGWQACARFIKKVCVVASMRWMMCNLSLSWFSIFLVLGVTCQIWPWTNTSLISVQLVLLTATTATCAMVTGLRVSSYAHWWQCKVSGN